MDHVLLASDTHKLRLPNGAENLTHFPGSLACRQH